MVPADAPEGSLVIGVAKWIGTLAPTIVFGALMGSGFILGLGILCAVFAFRDERDQPVYWIYNYKRGAYYPFVPAGGDQRRDTERELRLKAQIGNELPVEAELERWFPLWGIPI